MKNEFKSLKWKLWTTPLSGYYGKIHEAHRLTILSSTLDVYNMINPIKQNINRSISYNKINRMGKIVYDPVEYIL